MSELALENSVYYPAPVPLGRDANGNWIYYEIDLAESPGREA